MPPNDAIFERALRVIPGGICSFGRRLPVNITFTSARGSKLYGSDGKEYVDYHAAAGPILLGHCHPDVNRRVAERLGQLDLVGLGPTELEVLVAEKINRHIPSANKVLFCSTGTESTLHTIHLARSVTGRRKLIKFQGCMHGWHDYLYMNIWSAPQKIGQRDPHSTGLLQEAIEHTIVLRYNDLDQVEDTLKAEHDDIAALFVEPIAHTMGCVPPKPGFLEGLRELCTQYGVILVFDEIVTGFRHSLGGFQSLCKVTPDITVLGKGMSNGYPCAAICGRADIMDNFNSAIGTVAIAGTHNANPVGLAAALATIEILELKQVHPYIFELGEMMRQGLEEIVDRIGLKAHVAGFGSIFVLYFGEGPMHSFSDVLRSDADSSTDYARKMIERGFLIFPMNGRRCCISASHTINDITSTLQAAEDSLAEMATRPVI